MRQRTVRDSSVFVPGATPSQAVEMQTAIRGQEGTLLFTLDASPLYGQQGDFTVLRIPTGAVLIEVQRDSQRRLHYIHSSPGTGTRVASVELPDFTPDRAFLVILTWSPSEIGLNAGFQGSAPATAAGTASGIAMRLEGGAVYEIGADRVMGYQIMQGGELALRETAVEAWRSVGMAGEVHLRSQPMEGQLGKTVQANLAIVMLATGVETFLARRFEEMQLEGREPDVAALIAALVPNQLRGGYQGWSLQDLLAERRPDFGNYEQAKKAYRAAYELRFGDLGLSSATLSKIRHLFEFRNRIVHISPLLGLLNGPKVPPAKPVFAALDTAQSLHTAADEFIQAVLRASLAGNEPSRH